MKKMWSSVWVMVFFPSPSLGWWFLFLLRLGGGVFLLFLLGLWLFSLLFRQGGGVFTRLPFWEVVFSPPLLFGWRFCSRLSLFKVVLWVVLQLTLCCRFDTTDEVM